MYDYLIVGAGPAGLFFADRCQELDPSARIGIVDSGVSLQKRGCPLVDSGNCRQCKTCLAVYGSGGAGMYSDGKLSSYPAGSGLARHLGCEETVIDLNRRVLGRIAGAVDDFGSRSSQASNSSVSSLAAFAKDTGAHLKSYDVVHLGTEGIQAFCIRYENELAERGIDFRWRHRVVATARHADAFAIAVQRPGSRAETLRAHRLVLATGKASGLTIRRHFASLGVGFHHNQIELGVRVEVRRDAIDALSDCHLDAKIKMQGAEGSEVRTFCVCNGGYLVSCYYDDFVEGGRIATISGFSFKHSKSDNSNFGLLVRKTFPSGIDPIKTQLGIVEAINRISGHDGTVVQRYEDFVAGRATTREALAANTITSTLPSSTPIDLNWLLPGFVISNIRQSMEKLGAISPSIADPDTLLHAPVWELVNDRPVLNSGFESTVPGLFVIGDATGIARGIVQAASTGLVAAQFATATASQAGELKSAS